jgi:hypothetical protein
MIEVHFDRINIAVRHGADPIDRECNVETVKLLFTLVVPVVDRNTKCRTVVKRNEIPAKPLRKAGLNTNKIFYGVPERRRAFQCLCDQAKGGKFEACAQQRAKVIAARCLGTPVEHTQRGPKGNSIVDKEVFAPDFETFQDLVGFDSKLLEKCGYASKLPDSLQRFRHDSSFATAINVGMVIGSGSS